MSAPAATSNLNDAQRAALDLGRDLLVSAGAGAGKTQVLGLRYLAIIEEARAKVSEIVAFTFTEKAAAEMRERVQQLLLDRIAEVTDKQRLENLRRAQAEFARNRISTVHGFCHRVLRDYAWEAGLEPRAPILDERAQSLARESAIRSVLLRTDASERPELASALVSLGAAVRLRSLSQTLVSMLKDRAAVRGPLMRGAELWNDPAAEIERRAKLWQSLVAEELNAAMEAAKQIDYAAASGAKDGDKLRGKVESVRAAIEAQDVAVLREELFTSKGEPRSLRGNKTNWKHNPDAIVSVIEQLNAVAAALLPVVEILDASIDADFERRAGSVVRDLALVFDAVCEAYTQECAGGLDFLDLELKAIDLLRSNKQVRSQLAATVSYLLVDEYQDTNPVQAELFELLATDNETPGRFFAVGDAKQSIYAFRGSDVRVFNQALDWIPERNRNTSVADQVQTLPWGLESAEDCRDGLVRLEHNYRTVEPLLKAGNAVFANIFARDEWRDFDARHQQMIYGSDKQLMGTPLEFHVLAQRKQSRGESEYDAERKRRDDEAELVAQTVHRLHDEEVALSDIAILVRTKGRNWQYRNAFARHELPLLVVGEGGLFKTQEALDCVNLLRALANPADDIAMLGVLRSPFAALSDSLLTTICLNDTTGTLLDRVRRAESQSPEVGQFLSRFDVLHAKAGRAAPSLLLTEGLSEFGYALSVSCGADAEQRLANVARTVEVVREMQHEIPSLAPLVRELRDRIEREEDESQGVPDRSVEGVRLMTIHKAKGLEFPVVILPELGAKSGGREQGMVRHLPSRDGEPLGIHLKRVGDDDRDGSQADFAAWMAKRDAREREAAEEKRVLYVAWTRAESRLILTATLKQDKGFSGDLSAHQLLRALGVKEWGKGPDSVSWHENVERVVPHSHRQAISAVDDAVHGQVLRLPEPLNIELTGPLGENFEPVNEVDPEAVELGSLVHAEMEKRMRLATAEVGTVDLRAKTHVQNAADALATRGKATRELPEFGIMTPDGAVRFDLLRDLGDGRYEIIDYKTDAVDADLAQHANTHHAEQLRRYATALETYLDARGAEANDIRLLVCFTAPEGLNAQQRLIEIPR